MTLLPIAVTAICLLLLALHLWTRHLTKTGTRRVPQAGQIVPVDGGNIHYVAAGDPSRPALVMIHGLTGQLQHFTYEMAHRLTDRFYVIALDRPGCGYSTRDCARLATLPEQARMIHEFLQAIHVKDPILVGHSLGGAVSLAMALDYPNHVRGLALLAPLTHRVPETPAIFKALEVRSESVRHLIANTIAVPLARLTAPHVIDQAFAPEPAPDDFLDRAGGALGLRPSAYVTGSQDLAGVDTSIDSQVARYGDLQVPGGILFGADDPILSPERQGASMAAFGLVYERLAGRGHMIPMTAPDDCADFVRRVAENALRTEPTPSNPSRA